MAKHKGTYPKVKVDKTPAVVREHVKILETLRERAKMLQEAIDDAIDILKSDDPQAFFQFYDQLLTMEVATIAIMKPLEGLDKVTFKTLEDIGLPDYEGSPELFGGIGITKK